MIESHLKIIGKVGRPHGLKGHFYVSGRSSLLPEAFHRASLTLCSGKGEQLCSSVLSHAIIQNRSAIRLADVTDRTAAEKIKGWAIYASEDLEDDPAEHLLEKQLFDVNGEKIGFICGTFNFGGVDTIEILDPEKNLKLLIPLAPSFFDLNNLNKRAASYQLKVPKDTFEELWYQQDE